MTIRITGDGPKITATGSGSTVLVEISTGQHDPGSFSGVHNDLTGRSTTGAHVGTAVSIDPTGFNNNLDETIVNAQLLAAAVDDLTTGGGGGGGTTGDSEIVATSTTLTGPPHTIAVAAAGSIDITVTLPDATDGDKGLVWYIRNLNSDSVVYVANLAEGDETITESKGLLVAGIETDTPGTYAWMKVGFVSETAAAGGGADLSDSTPQALGTAAAGTGTAAARDDHVHAMPTAADVGADADGAAQAVADSLGTAATKDAGSAGGVAELDVTGKVPSAQLPSYVDDVVEVANFAALPGTGETGKIYVTLDTNVTYRWSGSAYVEISASLALGETSSTAYRGDRGKTAYDHSQVVTGNPHGTTTTDIGAVPTARTLAGLDLTANRSASDLRTALSLVIGTDVQAYNATLTLLAALTTTSYGRALLELADAAAGRTALGLGNAATRNVGTTAGTVLAGDTTIPSAYTDENARDAIGTALVAGTGITVTVNDGADTITIAATSTLDELQVALVSQVFGG